jgi:hypothetical protein
LKIVKGSYVRYTGEVGDRTPNIGDLGRVLDVSSGKAMIIWHSGALKTGHPERSKVSAASTTSEYLSDLAPDIYHRTPKDVGDQISSQIKEAPTQLFSMLKQAKALPEIKKEVITYVMTRLKSEPYVEASIKDLSEVEKHHAIQSLASSLIKEHFGKRAS